MPRPGALLREAIASALSSRVASLVTIIMIAGMCATVLLTTGRTVGSEEAVLGSIDSAGTRSIVIRAEPDAGLDSTVLDRLQNLDGITWAGAFGPATDTTNTRIPDGTRVPLRLAYGSDLADLGLPDLPPVTNRTAWGSDTALEQLGLIEDVGGISTVAGLDYAVAGRIAVPDYLTFLEPVLLAPQTSGSPAPISILVVIADRPDLVAPVSDAVQSLLAVDDPTKITLTTSENIATLRALIEGQLGSFGRELVILVFAVTGVLVAVILSGLTALRRKDFGRRRALGASQTLIVVLLLCQMLILAAVGALLGSSIAIAALLATGDPLPGLDFIAAVVLLAVLVGLIAALLPAIAAARRDPIRELRVP